MARYTCCVCFVSEKRSSGNLRFCHICAEGVVCVDCFERIAEWVDEDGDKQHDDSIPCPICRVYLWTAQKIVIMRNALQYNAGTDRVYKLPLYRLWRLNWYQSGEYESKRCILWYYSEICIIKEGLRQVCGCRGNSALYARWVANWHETREYRRMICASAGHWDELTMMEKNDGRWEGAKADSHKG